MFLRTYLKGYKLAFALTLLLSVLFSFFNTISMYIFSFLIDNVLGKKKPDNIFSNFIFNFFGGNIEDLRNNLFFLSLFFLGFVFIANIFLYFRYNLQAYVSENFALKIRNDFYKRMINFDFKTINNTKSGDLIQRATSDINLIKDFFNGKFQEMVYAIFNSCFAMLVLFNINKKLASMSFISLPVTLLFSFFYTNKINKLFTYVDEIDGELNDHIHESISGKRIVRSFNLEEKVLEKLETIHKKYNKVKFKLDVSSSFYWSSTYILILLFNALILFFGIRQVKDNTLTIGGLFLFLHYQFSMSFPMRMLGRNITEYGKMKVSIKRLKEIIEIPIEDLEIGIKPEIKGEIKFENVDFDYDEKNLILKDLSFEIKPKEKIAFMGKVGSGKSSLTYLLTRLYEPKNGNIKIDNFSIKEISKSHIRKNISLVLQEPFLFSKTIKENILIGNPDLDEKKLNEILKICSIDEFLEKFKNGIDTIVGEKGVTLSGGQKQRVAIARNLAFDSPIIIFDDSLSALDNKTSKMIKENLVKMNKYTMIFITQSVNIAKECDKIFVFDKGKIIEQGNHGELVSKGGLYHRINLLQSMVKE